MKPRNLPSPAEVRAEFIRLRDSADFKQQRLAWRIAAAVGASALSADDVEPVMTSNAIYRDFADWIGSERFCRDFDRVCDFQDKLVAVCRVKRTRNAARCDRLPEQCAWCKQATLCQPYVTGQMAGCSPADAASRQASLKPLKEQP